MMAMTAEEVLGVYQEYGPGMDHIRAVKRIHKRELEDEFKDTTPPDKVLVRFGVKDSKGKDIQTGWKISGGRKDKRHGPVEAGKGFSRYGKSLYDSMFAGWNDDESGIAG